MSEEDTPKTTRILEVGYMSDTEFDEVAFQYVLDKWHRNWDAPPSRCEGLNLSGYLSPMEGLDVINLIYDKESGKLCVRDCEMAVIDKETMEILKGDSSPIDGYLDTGSSYNIISSRIARLGTFRPDGDPAPIRLGSSRVICKRFSGVIIVNGKAVVGYFYATPPEHDLTLNKNGKILDLLLGMPFIQKFRLVISGPSPMAELRSDNIIFD